MKQFVIYIWISLLFFSCATNKNLKRRNSDEYFIGSGVVSYFLPDIPEWANFNSSSLCKRNFPIRYLNFKKLRESFSFSYEQAIQFQYLFNMENEKLKRVSGVHFLPFKDEESLFYTVLDQVQAGLVAFRKPKFNSVNLVWIDGFLKERNGIKKLKRLMKSSHMDKGHPVFISLCMTHEEIRNFQQKNKMVDYNARVIPYEMFSPFGPINKFENKFSLSFEKMFKKKQKLNLFIPKKEQLPQEFEGKFIVHKY